MITELPARIERLFISSTLVGRSKELLEPFRQREVEGCLLWFGYVLDATTCVASMCVCPEQRSHSTYYEIPATAMRDVRRKVRPYGLLLLVQIHSHPARAFFSDWDEDHALNNRAGALNMVVPDYGMGRWIDPSNFCMVERTEDGQWRPWSANDWQRLVIVPDGLRVSP